MKTGGLKRSGAVVLIVLAVALMGCTKKTTVIVPASPAVQAPPSVESSMVESPMVESPSVGAPAAPSGLTAAMVVDAMGSKAQSQFCAGYAALNDEQAALAAFMSGYKQNTSPSGEEVFAELVSRC